MPDAHRSLPADATSQDVATQDVAPQDVVAPPPDRPVPPADAQTSPDVMSVAADMAPPMDGPRDATTMPADALDVGAIPDTALAPDVIHDGDALAPAPDAAPPTPDAALPPPDVAPPIPDAGLPGPQLPSEPPPFGTSVLVANACTTAGGFRDPPGFAPRVLEGLQRGYQPRPMDLDGDGDLDVVVPVDDSFHRNLGGRFDLPVRLPVSALAGVAGTADLDGDGLTDWLEHEGGRGGLYWHRNPGGGRFTDRQPIVLGAVRWPVAADVDADGDQDILAEEDGVPLVLVNRGPAQFDRRPLPEFPSGRLTLVWDVADADGDGLVDLLVYVDDHPDEDSDVLVVLWNHGDGTFVARTRVLGRARAGSSYDSARFVDVDGDGILDVGYQSGWYLDGWVRGLGGQSFAAVPETFDVPDNIGGDFIDLDGDGDLDFLTTGSYQQAYYVSENMGNGRFAAHRPVNLQPLHALVDMNVDGALDECRERLAGDLSVEHNLGGFQFENVDPVETDTVFSFQAGDFDGNGTLDLMSRGAPRAGMSRLLLWQVAPGVFDAAIAVLPEGSGSVVSVADADGDGLDDLLVVDSERRAGFARGLGDGRFEAPTPLTPVLPRFSAVVSVADVDRDGLADVIVVAERATWFSQVEPGVARPLADPRMTLHYDARVLLADLDDDGEPDLVAGNFDDDTSSFTLYLMRGLGDGTFAPLEDATRLGPGKSAVAATDLDADGDLDIVAGTSNYATVWYRHEPDGTFTLVPVTGSFKLLAVGDLDANGADDLLVEAVEQTYLLLNRGDGTFETPWSVPAETIVDLDGDGFLDLLDDEWIRGPLTADWPRPQALPEVPAGGPLALADLDFDGLTEVAVADEAGGVTVASADEDGNFEPLLSIGPWAGAVSALRFVDVDGDALPDVLARAGDGWRMFAGDGAAVSPEGYALADDLPGADLQVGDLDGAGGLEVVLCAPDAAVRILRLGPESTANETGVIVPAGDRAVCALIDSDLDGDLDLLVAAGGQSVLYDNDGTGGFTPGAVAPACLDPVEMGVVDLNFDSFPDIACDQGHTGSWFANPGDVGGAWRNVALNGSESVWLVDLEPGGRPERVERYRGSFFFKRLDAAQNGWSASSNSIYDRLRDPVALAYTDLNGDGRTDVLISEAGQPGLLRLFQQPPCTVGRRVDEVDPP